jgi:pimeloyl-ACP methyl ester carboxylesterase
MHRWPIFGKGGCGRARNLGLPTAMDISSPTGDIPTDSLAPELIALGDGPRLLMVHGGPGFDHRYLAPGFAFLTSSRRLVFFDQPRCAADPPHLVTFDGTVQHAVRVLRYVAKGGAFGICAHSFGALLTVAALAAESGIKPDPIVFVNPAPIDRPHYEICRANLLRRFPPDVLAEAQALGAAGRPGDVIMQLLLPHYHAAPFDMPGQFGFDLGAYFSVDASLDDFDYRGSLARVGPFRALRTDGDFTTPDLVRELIDRASLYMCMPALGHFPFLEDPAAFRAAFVTMLAHQEALSDRSDAEGLFSA